jgi:hypothetical protein
MKIYTSQFLIVILTLLVSCPAMSANPLTYVCYILSPGNIWAGYKAYQVIQAAGQQLPTKELVIQMAKGGGLDMAILFGHAAITVGFEMLFGEGSASAKTCDFCFCKITEPLIFPGDTNSGAIAYALTKIAVAAGIGAAAAKYRAQKPDTQSSSSSSSAPTEKAA